MRRGLTIMIGCLIGTSAAAQTVQNVTAATLARDPTRFIGHPIRVGRMGCFSSPETGVRCTSYAGVYVLVGAVAPATMKSRIDGTCGGIVEGEEDPTCLFDLVFTPAAASRGSGEVTRGDRSVTAPVWIVRTTAATLSEHH